MKFKKEQQLFFSSGLTAELGPFELNREESHHISNVLRKEVGDVLTLTNGQGVLAQAHIRVKSKKSSVVEVTEIVDNQPQESSLTIAIAPTKNISRFEWFLEKATEIGISKVIPMICNHSERKVIKRERLEKLIVAAMKQSGRLWLPEIIEMTSFKDVLSMNEYQNSFIAHCHDTKKINLQDSKISNSTVDTRTIILIGPEGGFSQSEVAMSKEHDYKEISLGNYRLRSETAGIVACQLVANLSI